MANGTTITIVPSEQRQMTFETDDSTGYREKSADEATSTDLSHHADIISITEKKPLWRFALMTAALLTAVFFVALDVNILGSSISHIESLDEAILPRSGRLTITWHSYGHT